MKKEQLEDAAKRGSFDTEEEEEEEEAIEAVPGLIQELKEE